jgi:hypothetical protein
LTLVLLSLSELSCNSKKVNLQFEPEARAISRRLGLPAVRHPKLAVDPAGDALYVLGVSGTDPDARLVLLTSVDGGDTFEAPVQVNETGTNVGSHGENSPALVFGPGEKIFVMWEEQAEEVTKLMFSSSMDFGASFEKPVHVSDQTTATYAGYPTMAVAPNKAICAAWLDFRDSADHPDSASIYFACSSDEGATFSKNVKVADSVCPCCRPSLIYGPRGEVMIFWRKIYPGNVRDIAVSLSRDGGLTFASPVRVAEDGWKLDGCPDSGPAVIREGQRVYVAWMTEATRQRAGIRFSWSDDDGKTFAPVVMASQKTLDANHPAFAPLSDGHVLLTFQARDPLQNAGWTAIRPYVIEIDNHGGLSNPTPITGGALPVEFPTLAMGNAGRVFFAWTETTGDKPAVMMLRARMTN